jgi:hypothetical protein
MADVTLGPSIEQPKAVGIPPITCGRVPSRALACKTMLPTMSACSSRERRVLAML